MFAVADDGGALLGWAAIITAAGGFVGIVATAVAQLRKKNGNGTVMPPVGDPEHSTMWMQMLEQLEAANVRADHAERRAEEAERELLASLRKAAKR